MARVSDFSNRPPGNLAVRTRSRRTLSTKDAANLLAAVSLVEEARDTFTTLAVESHSLALRELFIFFARTMECYATLVREKMVSKCQNKDPHPA